MISISPEDKGGGRIMQRKKQPVNFTLTLRYQII